MDFSDGFFSVWRGVWHNEYVTRQPWSPGLFWMWMISRACWDDEQEVFLNGLTWKLKRGELVTSVREMAKITGWGEQKTRTQCAEIVRRKMITLDSTPRGTVIKLLKYQEYRQFFNSKKHTEQHTREQTNHHTDNTPITHRPSGLYIIEKAEEAEEVEKEKVKKEKEKIKFEQTRKILTSQPYNWPAIEEWLILADENQILEAFSLILAINGAEINELNKIFPNISDIFTPTGVRALLTMRQSTSQLS